MRSGRDKAAGKDWCGWAGLRACAGKLVGHTRSRSECLRVVHAEILAPRVEAYLRRVCKGTVWSEPQLWLQDTAPSHHVGHLHTLEPWGYRKAKLEANAPST